MRNTNASNEISRPGSQSEGGRPEFIRLPKAGSLCRYTGLSRSKLNELILPTAANSFNPPVRSISLRTRGQQRAVRLINYASLLDYLQSLEVEQAPAVTSAEGAPTQTPSQGALSPICTNLDAVTMTWSWPAMAPHSISGTH